MHHRPLIVGVAAVVATLDVAYRVFVRARLRRWAGILLGSEEV